jgi:hypothetical protein
MLVEDIGLLPGHRAPCPVCGHPTGDCAPEGQPHIKIIPGEDPSRNPDATVTVDRVVIQELFVGRSKRKTRVKLYRPGQRITPAQAEEVGLFDSEDDPLVIPPDRAVGAYAHHK